MKIATIIVRVLLGLMFLFASGSYFYGKYKGEEHPMPDGDMKTFMEGLSVSYLMDFVKIVEFVAGLLLVVGRYVTFGNIILFPVTLNIFLFHAFLEPDDLLVPAVLLLAQFFLFYRYWNNYRALLTP